MLTPYTLIGLVLLIAFLIYAAVTHKIPGVDTPNHEAKKPKPKTRNKKSATPFLDQYTIDFTQQARDGSIDPVIGREEEVLRLAQVLSRRNKNNALLIGEPGVGKTAIAEALAQRIISEDVPTILLDKRVLSLDVSTLLSGTKYRGEFEERANQIVTEIEQSGRSIILFIDEVHTVIQSQGTEGAVNFADILKPALARGDLQMIGATTLDEYEHYIKTDLSLERRFQPIQVDEPSREETLAILQGVKEKYAEYHKVEFTDAALEAAVDLSTRYIKDRKLPDKAIDAIDEAAAMVRVSHVHDHIPALLYNAAVNAHPDVAKLWKDIQTLDKKLLHGIGAEKQSLKAKREALEDQLNEIGLKTVDSSDVKAVVRNS